MEESLPKYRWIADLLEQRIVAGELAAGAVLPGEKRLARELGANHLTVRRALALLVDRGLVHTVPSRGTYVGRSPVTKPATPHGLVGVMFSDVELYFLRIVGELEALMVPRGLSPVVRLTRGSPTREREILADFQRLGVAGILAAPMARGEEAYRDVSVPLVFFDSRLAGLPVPSVVTDDFQGSRAAVAHLVSLGHERIAHIGGGREATSDERQRGYELAMNEAGLAMPEGFRLRRQYSREWGHLAAERVLAESPAPTALFCGSDVIAAGARRYLQESGRHCPEDVSVIGYSDSELSRDLQLTTVRQPMQRLAATAWRVLAALLEGRHTPQENRLETSLVVRRSTAPPPRARSKKP
jgi:LacI family transcriptional regulator, repressor for deo operon, udp, cdd, tsx, nupC, and nupG